MTYGSTRTRNGTCADAEGIAALSDDRCLLLAGQDGELRGFTQLDTAAAGRDVCLDVPHGNARAISFYEYAWPAAAVSRCAEDGRPASNTVPPPAPG